MKLYICEMTRGEYNVLRGWVCPIGENPNDEGYFF